MVSQKYKLFMVCISISLFVIVFFKNTLLTQYQIHIDRKETNLLVKGKFLLVLVTTWNFSPEKFAVYITTAHIWASWPLLVQPILYKSPLYRNNVNHSVLDIYLRKHWKIYNIPKVACGQIPVLKSMVLHALTAFADHEFYGYANGDILFDESLIKTLKSIREKIPQERPILVVGQRTNVNFTNRGYILNSDRILQLAQSGVLMKGVAIDYFITNRQFPWHLVLDLVIGRIHYDNWMVYFANSQNVTVIDATYTLTAVHQTTSDGNDAGWKHPHKYCNAAIIRANKKQFRTRWGYTWCAPYYTKKNPQTNAIDILWRKVSPSCRK